MVEIKVKEFAKKYVERNKEEKLVNVINNLNEALKRKKSGELCSICKSNPIWAIGSALGGFKGCFTCITGEIDDSNEYEVV